MHTEIKHNTPTKLLKWRPKFHYFYIPDCRQPCMLQNTSGVKHVRPCKHSLPLSFISPTSSKRWSCNIWEIPKYYCFSFWPEMQAFLLAMHFYTSLADSCHLQQKQQWGHIWKSCTKNPPLKPKKHIQDLQNKYSILVFNSEYCQVRNNSERYLCM